MNPTPRRPFLIFNPASGRGRGAKRLHAHLELLRRQFGDFRHAATSFAGEEAALVDQALSDDVNVIVAVGGDGTWSNVADRIVASGREDVEFGMLAAGTGNDFARNFGLSAKRPEEAVRALAEGEIRLVDVGRVTSPGRKVRGGGPEPVSGRHFINLIGFGFDVAVIVAAKGARFLRGEVLYKVTALQQLFRFGGFDFELESDELPVSGRHLMLTISNCPFFGGSFPIAPAAELDDGLLDACAIGDASPFRRMRIFNMAERGRHVLAPEVQTRRSATYVVRFDSPPSYELDGELWESETNEVVVEVVPRALKVVGS
jgi:diacylglycerol kinase (ATP)